MKGTVTYIRLLTDCFPEMYNFYTDVLGLECKMGNVDDVYAEFVAGSIKIAIFDRTLMAEALELTPTENVQECQDKSILIYQVDDLDQVAEELEKKGVTLLYPPTTRHEWGVRTLHLRDPSGNIIEINSVLK